MLQANYRIRIQPDSCVYIIKSIAGYSRIEVSKNTEVKPEDIIARTSVNAGYSSINISQKLQIDPIDGEKVLQKKVGAVIYKGELLARRRKLFGESVVTAPTDGIIENYNKKTGEIRLKFLTKESQISSGVYGIVEEVDRIAGKVYIKSLVTQIYGIIGSGKERSGILHFLEGGNSHLVQSSQISATFKGTILVGGALIYKDALKKATSEGVLGVITGGLNLDTYQSMSSGGLRLDKKTATDVGISVLATEGFGPIPIAENIYQTLKNYESRLVFLNGNSARMLLPSTSPDSILTVRKIALPKPNSSEIAPEPSVQELSVGCEVRIIWPPFMGLVAKVVAVDNSVTMLESGISTFMVTVEGNQRKLKVPYTNIEIIGLPKK